MKNNRDTLQERRVFCGLRMAAAISLNLTLVVCTGLGPGAYDWAKDWDVNGRPRMESLEKRVEFLEKRMEEKMP